MQPGFRTIVHVDMDAFFASVEILDHPHLRGKPVVVGAAPQKGRGVVSAASYEARKFGVRAAQPVSTAYQFCPQAVFMPPRFARYREVSDAVMAILSEFSDRLVRLSIDEAVLDCSESGKKFGTWRKLGSAIKAAIRSKLELSCTIGMASGKTIAKMASETGKPDGLILVPPGKEAEFLSALPVEAIPGVGPRAKEALHRMGLRQIADLRSASPFTLIAALGRWAARLHDLANGIDTEPIDTSHERKSFGEERTYDTDLALRDDVHSALSALAEDLALRLESGGVSGRTITLKIRFADFLTITRSQTIPVPTRSVELLLATAWRLFCDNVSEERLQTEKIRLLGIQLSKLYTASPGEQLWLF